MGVHAAEFWMVGDDFGVGTTAKHHLRTLRPRFPAWFVAKRLEAANSSDQALSNLTGNRFG